jgi:uncharacterized membrane protein
MNLSASLFPDGWHGFMLVLATLALYVSLRHAPWSRLKEQTLLHAALGFAVGLALIWSLNAGVKPGLSLHLLGAMAANLMFGPRLAVAVMALTLTAVTINGAIEWQAWPLNFVLMVAAPVYFAWCLQRLIERVLPAHFFVFVFVTSFAGAALTVMAQGAVASAVLTLAGAFPAEFLLSGYLPYFLLLGFAEAWISGAVVTLLVVYRPGLVTAFDDRRYLLDK